MFVSGKKISTYPVGSLVRITPVGVQNMRARGNTTESGWPAGNISTLYGTGQDMLDMLAYFPLLLLRVPVTLTKHYSGNTNDVDCVIRVLFEDEDININIPLTRCVRDSFGTRVVTFEVEEILEILQKGS
jgi:hypothetical protein